MARRSAASTPIEAVEPTKTVRVFEEHSYVKEVPVVDPLAIQPIEEEAVPDIFSTFNEIVTTNQNAILRIWLLPNYHIDGRSSTTGTDREYCGSVPYSSDNAALLDQIQGRVPQGGMLQLELFNDGAIRKRGLLKLMKSILPISPGYTPQGTHLVINQPQTPSAPAAAMNPADVMREHMSLAKDLVAMARDLQPQTPVAVEGASKSAEDRLLEAVLVKALESDKTPIDKVLEAMSGRRSEPGIMETLMPVIGEVIKAFAPSINAVIQRQAQVVAQQQQPTNGLAQPAQLGPAVEAPLVEGEQQQAPVVVDPVQRDYFQTIIRMLEDCTRHVELASVGGGSKSVLPSAEAVLELAERYPEQLGGTINILLMALPIEVLDSCAMLLDERGQQHIATILRPNAAALAWVKELQDECKRILKDSSDSESEVTTDEDKRTD